MHYINSKGLKPAQLPLHISSSLQNKYNPRVVWVPFNKFWTSEKASHLCRCICDKLTLFMARKNLSLEVRTSLHSYLKHKPRSCSLDWKILRREFLKTAWPKLSARTTIPPVLSIATFISATPTCFITQVQFKS